MDPGTVVLLHSPLVGVEGWGALPQALRRDGVTVLAGHSGAGPLLPAVGAALRAGGRPTGGYLFCDAGLPRAGASRLDLLAEALGWPTARLPAGHFHALVDPGGLAGVMLGLLARM